MRHPRSKNGEQFPFVLAFRIDAEGKVALEQAASARGVPIGVLARTLVSRGLESELRVPAVRRAVSNAAEIRTLLGEVGKIGSNLNQIAKVMNASTSPGTLTSHLDRLRSIEADASAIRELAITALRGGR